MCLLRRVESIDGSAEVGKDYVAVNETLIFEPNELDKQVNTTLIFPRPGHTDLSGLRPFML